MNRLALLLSVTFIGAAAPMRAVVPAPAPLPLRFDHALLGNVVRVFSARYHVPFSIEAHAKSPITGDFTKDSLPAAVAEVARQAHLYAIPMGKKPADGYTFSLVAPPPAPKAAAAAGPSPAEVTAERERQQLLLQRQKLLQQAAQIGS